MDQKFIMDFIDSVEKLDDRSRGFNKRVLHISDGIVQYYSKIPKNFDPDNPSTLGTPKYGIEIEELIDVKDSEPSLLQGLQDRIISIYFFKGSLKTPQQIKELLLVKAGKKPGKPSKNSSKQEMKWVFLFETSDARRKCGDIMSRNILQCCPTEIREKVSVKAFIDTYKIHTRMTVFPTAFMKNSEMKRTFGVDDSQDENEEAMRELLEKKDRYEQLKLDRLREDERRRKLEEEERERIRQEMEEEQKRQALLREEEEKKRREEEVKRARLEQERLMRIKVQTAWEFRYYQAMEDCIDANGKFDESMRQGVKLVKYVEVFREQAHKTVKEIVVELLENEIKKNSVSFDRPSMVERTDTRKSILQNPKKSSIFVKKAEKSGKRKGEESTYNETLKDLSEGTYIFKRNNMLIRIACCENTRRVLWFPVKSQFYKAIENKFSEDQLFTYQDWAYFYSPVHSKLRKRLFSDEFKSLNYLNDVCMTIRTNEKNFRIKVPIACSVQYMGFFALVIAKPPCALDETSLAYGPSFFDGTYKSNNKLDREIEMLGRALSIKPHNFYWNPAELQPKRRNQGLQTEDKKNAIYLSYFTEIHIGQFEEFEQIKAMLKVYSEEEIDIFQMRKQGIFYLNRCQDIVPTIVEEEYAQLFDVYQQIKLSTELEEDQILLVDECLNKFPTTRAEPQFIQTYYDTGYKTQQKNKLYNPDAYETVQESNDVHADQLELAEMSKFYKRNYLSEFIVKVDDMELNIVDGHDLRVALSSFGISLRHIGDLARLTSQPHIRALLEREMIARTLKNIFLTQLAEEALNIKEEQIPMKNVEIKANQSSYSEPEEVEQSFRRTTTINRKQSLMVIPFVRQYQERMPMDEYLDQMHKEHLIDFINLVFSPQSVLFWEQVIHKQVISDFNYDLEISIKGLCPGGLLHAVLYNLKCDIDFEPMFIHCSTPYPQVRKEEVIQKFKLKQYLHQKSYQKFFNMPLHTTNTNNTPGINTPQGASTPLTRRSKPSTELPQPGKAENFFGVNDIISIRLDHKSYSLNDLEISKICQKIATYKRSRSYDLAIKSLMIQLTLVDGLVQSNSVIMTKINIFSDLADIYLQKGDFVQSIMNVSHALQLVYPNVVFPEAKQSQEFCQQFLSQITRNKLVPKMGVIKPMITLFKCLSTQPEYSGTVQELFDILLFMVEFSLGAQHPIYAVIFQIMAECFQNNKLFDDARMMYQSQTLCLLQTVGQRHKTTAEAYFTMAKFLHIVLEQKEDSITHYERAFLTFETLVGINSPKCTQVAVLLSEVLTDCGRNTEALYYTNLAIKFYQQHLSGNLEILLKLKAQKALNLSRMKQYGLCKKEAEECAKIYFQETLTPQSQQTMKMVVRIHLEVYLIELNKEHRNFLYQVFDQIQENFARDGLLDTLNEDQTVSRALKNVLGKIQTLTTIQAFLERIMGNFIDSTGADTNRFVYNFKKDSFNSVYANFQGQVSFQEAVEDYENLIIAVGRTIIQNYFMLLLIN